MAGGVHLRAVVSWQRPNNGSHYCDLIVCWALAMNHLCESSQPRWEVGGGVIPTLQMRKQE